MDKKEQTVFKKNMARYTFCSPKIKTKGIMEIDDPKPNAKTE